jgi:MFS family permease
LPLRLFRISVFTVANTMAFLAGMIMFGAIIYLPAYFQLVRDVSATISGLLMLPLMGALLVASVLGGRAVSRLGRYKPFVMVGTALMTLGVWLLTHLGVHTSFVTAGLYLVPLGAGMGLSMQNLVLAIQNALPVRDMGTGTSAINFFRSMGGSFGTAVFGAVLTARLAFWLPHFVAGSAGHPVNTDIISAPAAVHRLPETVQGGISDAFVHSLHSVFWVGVPIAAATFVLSFFLAEIPLRLTSGMGEELAEGAAAALVPDELPELLDVPDTAEDAGRLGSEGSDRPQSVPGGP